MTSCPHCGGDITRRRRGEPRVRRDDHPPEGASIDMLIQRKLNWSDDHLDKDWRRRRRMVENADREPTGAFELAKYPGGIDWLRVDA